MSVKSLELDIDSQGEAQFNGLKLTVEEFLSLPDDGFKYELMNGVAIVSPRPTPYHQRAAREILLQLGFFLKTSPIGEVFAELDVHLGKRIDGQDLVYVPDVIFLRNDKLAQIKDRIIGAPDLVVEVVSRGSRRMDTLTKREDYERFGVSEYWIIDPQRESFTILRLENGRFVEKSISGDRYITPTIPGFSLNVTEVRATFTRR